MKSVDIIIPIYYKNIAEIEDSVNRQINDYNKNLRHYNWKIVIGINGPDRNGIMDKVKKICQKNQNVVYDYTSETGRGASLNKIFVNSKADFVCYMDVDLATGIDAVPRMLKELENNDLVVGSKYIKGSIHYRTAIRFLLSKTYNSIITKLVLNAKFTDAQCGFKGMKVEAAKKITSLIRDKGWFWDTELLYIAQKKNLSFKEIPISWIEKGNSGVKLFKTIKEFIVKIIKLKYRNL